MKMKMKHLFLMFYVLVNIQISYAYDERQKQHDYEQLAKTKQSCEDEKQCSVCVKRIVSARLPFLMTDYEGEYHICSNGKNNRNREKVECIKENKILHICDSYLKKSL